MTKPTVIDYKVNDLSNDVEALKSDVKKIMNNHLPHLQNAVTELNGKIDNLTNRVNAAVAINVVLMIAGVVGVILLTK